MAKIFNVNGACRPEVHYMVDIRSRLEAVKKMVDNGDYFTINRARQFGKTTTLNALADYLKSDYIVISLDFQTMGTSSFENDQSFAATFSSELLMPLKLFRKRLKSSFWLSRRKRPEFIPLTRFSE